MMMKKLFLLLSLIVPSIAWAQDSVSLTNQIFLEKVKEENGQQTVTLEEPKVVVPGDKLVFVLNYKNSSGQPAANFVVTNPIPPAVTFDGSEDASADVSVDGGKTFGKLAALTVRNPDGTDRPATAADVTAVRWTFTQPIPAGGAGKVSFRGVVK
jgi:uncharacterized repeat protein (TIGR01451 family)